MRFAFASLLLFAVACSAETSSLPDAGVSRPARLADVGVLADAGVVADAGRSDSGVVFDAGAPLLDRASTNAFTCSTAREMIAAEVAGPEEYGKRPAVFTRTDGVFVNAHSTLSKDMIIAALKSDGALDAPIATAHRNATSIRGTSIAPAENGGYAITWIEDNRLYFARYDQNGGEVVAPKMLTLATPRNMLWHAMVAAENGHIAIAWIEGSSDAGFSNGIHVGFVDADGNTVREVKLAESAASSLLYSNGPVVADGAIGLAWVEAPRSSADVYFAKLSAASGEVQIAAKSIVHFDDHGSLGFAPPAVSLARFHGAWYAAWIEDFFSDEAAHAIIRVARLGEDGALATAPLALEGEAPDIEDVEPHLFEVDGSLALAWSRGGGARICGICTADHVLHAVMIDADVWAPASNVVEMPSTIVGERGQNGGVLALSIATSTTSILAAFQIRYHTQAQPASALISCVRN